MNILRKFWFIFGGNDSRRGGGVVKDIYKVK